MPQPFQSSFIPKESSSQNSFDKRSFGLVGLISLLFLVFSLLASLGLFVYVRVLKSNISSLSNQVALAEQNMEDTVIEEMFRFNQRLNSVKGIVSRHRVVSNFLDLLSSNTVSEVEYIEFQYTIMPTGNVAVLLDGTAKNYASIALQENIFSNNKYIKLLKFGDLSLSSQNGRVAFRLNIEANPEISVYNPEIIEMQSSTTTVSVKNSNSVEEDLPDTMEEIDNLNLPPLDL